MASYVRRATASDRDYLLRELRTMRSDASAREHPLIAKFKKMVDFEHFTFSGLDLDGFRVGTAAHLVTNMPDRFLDGYRAGGFIDVDPLMRRSTETRPLSCWANIPESEMKAPGVVDLVELMRNTGIVGRTGLSFWSDGIPYGVAVFTRARPFQEDELSILEALAQPIHQSFADRALKVLNERLALSSGEKLCLKLAAKGLTSEEIAAESSYSPDTVTTYIKSATKKLGASNRTQAVAEAIRRRLFS